MNVKMITVLVKISQSTDVVSTECPNLFLTHSYFSVTFSQSTRCPPKHFAVNVDACTKRPRHGSSQGSETQTPAKTHHLFSKAISSQLNLTLRLA